MSMMLEGLHRSRQLLRSTAGPNQDGAADIDHRSAMRCQDGTRYHIAEKEFAYRLTGVQPYTTTRYWAYEHPRVEPAATELH